MRAILWIRWPLLVTAYYCFTCGSLTGSWLPEGWSAAALGCAGSGPEASWPQPCGGLLPDADARMSSNGRLFVQCDSMKRGRIGYQCMMQCYMQWPAVHFVMLCVMLCGTTEQALVELTPEMDRFQLEVLIGTLVHASSDSAELLTSDQ